MKSKIKLMIVDDQNIFAESLANTLNLYDCVEVIETAENGKVALEKIAKREPEVLILDYEMPIMDGEKTAAEVVKKFPKIKVIILSMYDEVELIKHLYHIGIHSFLPKNCDSQQLIEVIGIVYKEGQYIPNEIVNRMNNSIDELKCTTNRLNKVELNIIKLMCFGKRDKEIAERLDISIHTLKFHKENIKEKTGIITPAQFGVYGVKHKIVDLRDFRLK